MINLTARNRLILLKTICAGLALVLGVGLFGNAAMGSNSCGMKCCCHSGATQMKPSTEMQMRSSMGCCSGASLSPCDMQGAEPVDLPETALASWRPNLTGADGSNVVHTAFIELGQHISNNYPSQTLDPQFNSPPLYIQKLSFLI